MLLGYIVAGLVTLVLVGIFDRDFLQRPGLVLIATLAWPIVLLMLFAGMVDGFLGKIQQKRR